ncbi:MAG TPA: PEGA domain-containing protein [Phycisphaerales bacterium]|nr:PEGA domain-containing protein [Phycisphaerales bacterium]
MQRFLIAAGVVFALVLLGGCATILNGDTQSVTFNTDPEGAMVKIDGTSYGRTPVSIPVPRKGFDKQVEVSLEGYKTEMFQLKNNPVNGATLLNILWFPGAIVDGISGRGGSYQESVRLVLERGVGVNNRSEETSKATPAGSKNWK